LEKYIESSYFTFVTMTTIGFGDRVAKSKEEQIYVIFFSFIACGVFGYVVSTLMGMMQIL